jgi:hypothetical protein
LLGSRHLIPKTYGSPLSEITVLTTGEDDRAVTNQTKCPRSVDCAPYPQSVERGFFQSKQSADFAEKRVPWFFAHNEYVSAAVSGIAAFFPH